MQLVKVSSLDSSHSTMDNAHTEAYEEEHVHKVYEEIADHFSSTRYKVRMMAIEHAVRRYSVKF